MYSDQQNKQNDKAVYSDQDEDDAKRTSVLSNKSGNHPQQPIPNFQQNGQYKQQHEDNFDGFQKNKLENLDGFETQPQYDGGILIQPNTQGVQIQNDTNDQFVSVQSQSVSQNLNITDQIQPLTETNQLVPEQNPYHQNNNTEQILHSQPYQTIEQPHQIQVQVQGEVQQNKQEQNMENNNNEGEQNKPQHTEQKIQENQKRLEGEVNSQNVNVPDQHVGVGQAKIGQEIHSEHVQVQQQHKIEGNNLHNVGQNVNHQNNYHQNVNHENIHVNQQQQQNIQVNHQQHHEHQHQQHHEHEHKHEDHHQHPTQRKQQQKIQHNIIHPEIPDNSNIKSQPFNPSQLSQPSKVEQPHHVHVMQHPNNVQQNLQAKIGEEISTNKEEQTLKTQQNLEIQRNQYEKRLIKQINSQYKQPQSNEKLQRKDSSEAPLGSAFSTSKADQQIKASRQTKPLQEQQIQNDESICSRRILGTSAKQKPTKEQQQGKKSKPCECKIM